MKKIIFFLFLFIQFAIEAQIKTDPIFENRGRGGQMTNEAEFFQNNK